MRRLYLISLFRRGPCFFSDLLLEIFVDSVYVTVLYGMVVCVISFKWSKYILENVLLAIFFCPGGNAW